MSTSAAVWPGVELVGDVLVDPVGGVARLVERDDADRDEERDHDRGEDRVDDEDRRCARHLQAREVANERVQRERDDARRQEEEENVPELRREQEREDEENGQDDQLDPSRDLDRRAGAGHARDRTAERCGRPARDLATVRTWRLRAHVTPRGFVPIVGGRRPARGASRLQP